MQRVNPGQKRGFGVVLSKTVDADYHSQNGDECYPFDHCAGTKHNFTLSTDSQYVRFGEKREPVLGPKSAKGTGQK